MKKIHIINAFNTGMAGQRFHINSSPCQRRKTLHPVISYFFLTGKRQTSAEAAALTSVAFRCAEGEDVWAWRWKTHLIYAWSSPAQVVLVKGGDRRLANAFICTLTFGPLCRENPAKRQVFVQSAQLFLSELVTHKYMGYIKKNGHRNRWVTMVAPWLAQSPHNKKVNPQLGRAFLMSVWVSSRCFSVAYNQKHVF